MSFVHLAFKRTFRHSLLLFELAWDSFDHGNNVHRSYRNNSFRKRKHFFSTRRSLPVDHRRWDSLLLLCSLSFSFRFGTGRTGTFIAMNILIDLINENENVSTFKLDLMGVVRQLRFDRNKLVEREVRDENESFRWTVFIICCSFQDEYLLLYRSVDEYLQRKSRSETRPISSLSYRSDLNQVFINDPRLSPDLSIRNEIQTPKDEEILSVRF